MASNKRVCVIGAGPSGLSVLYQFARHAKEGRTIPEIVCYEKQDEWMGLWNYSWRTGLDENGEINHNGMYRHLWSNGPKECLEFPDYTFDKHFGRPIPSFPPRAVLRDYLEGRFGQAGIKDMIRFRTIIKDVVYNKSTDDFSIVAKDLANDIVLEKERFDYIVVANGHFSIPSMPYFQGMETFPGRIMHSHDFRNAEEFSNQRLLLIGSSYSAEDLALQCTKFGSGKIIISYRTKPMAFRWPEGVEERPLLTKLDGKTAHFKDGSSTEVDAIILCTGYMYYYEFLHEDLRLKCPKNMVYPSNLYKGSLWLNGGNNKVYYTGAQDQYYTYTMFDVQGDWVAQSILGLIKLPSMEAMKQDAQQWVDRMNTLKDVHDDIDFQTDFVKDFCKDVKFPYNLDVGDMFHAWEDHKTEDITTYRDRSFTSIFTKKKSPIHHTKFMNAMDDSLECFMNQKL